MNGSKIIVEISLENVLLNKNVFKEKITRGKYIFLLK